MGFVYLLESVNEDKTIYKIGFTKGSVQKRIKSLQTGNGYNIKELCQYKTEYDQKLERTLHNLYNHYKLSGEWYSLEINDVANFLNTCDKIEKNFNILKDNPFFK